jgi:magnesium-transporting ATPase (P-type)
LNSTDMEDGAVVMGEGELIARLGASVERADGWLSTQVHDLPMAERCLRGYTDPCFQGSHSRAVMNAERVLRPPSWHSASVAESLARLQVSSGGLSAAEAGERLAKHGRNTLPEEARKTVWRVFFHQFQSPLIYILFAAAVLAFSLGKHEDSWVILIVVLINSVIGTFQEDRAERSMAALKKLSALKVNVLRDGVQQAILAEELVLGDLMLLAAGDAVTADARLLETRVLEVAEAALTGESLPVHKQVEPLPEDAVLADRANMVYSGTHITAGRGKAVVVATGLGTEVGKIASLTAAAQPPKTPLELRMEQLGRMLVVVAILLFLVVMIAGYLRGMPLVSILMVAVSQMVSLVPEGLPVALTIALAVGMQRMARRGAIVRTLASVETLGCTTIICTDKTGTLTKNEMTATTIWLADGRTVEVSGSGYAPDGDVSCDGVVLDPAADRVLRHILEAGVLCNDSQLVPPDAEDSRWRALGDPTEAALLTLAMKAGIEPAQLRHDWPRRAEIPFDSAANSRMDSAALRIYWAGWRSTAAGGKSEERDFTNRRSARGRRIALAWIRHAGGSGNRRIRRFRAVSWPRRVSGTGRSARSTTGGNKIRRGRVPGGGDPAGDGDGRSPGYGPRDRPQARHRAGR